MIAMKSKQEKLHSLKVQQQWYDALAKGSKTFEIRKNDREYNVGDNIVLWCYNGDIMLGGYEPLYYKITYVQEYGCEYGYVALGLKSWRGE